MDAAYCGTDTAGESSMNEAHWLACADPQPMLEFLEGKVSDRKLRLFVVACCRRIWKVLDHEKCHRAIEIAERCAEGFLSVAESYALGHEMELSVDYGLGDYLSKQTGYSAGACAEALQAVGLITGYLFSNAGPIARHASGSVVLQLAPHLSNFSYGEESEAAAAAAAAPFRAGEMAAQAALLRDIVGNPFRRVPFLLSHGRNPNEKTVEQLAQSSYDNRRLPEGTLDNDSLAILADALEEGGSDNEDLIAHCRQPGPHVRGCWAIDVLLRKTAMTEAEWLSCTELDKMLDFLRHIGRFSVRKSRLFGVAVCRRIWHLLPHEASRNAVEVAERFADGDATINDSAAVSKQAMQIAYQLPRNPHALKNAAYAAATVAEWVESPEAVAEKAANAFWEEDNENESRKEKQFHIRLFRCLFGNPLQPVHIDLSWLTSKVVRLAQAIYDDRAFERLPSLADALEDAGCDNADVLAHCRDPGPHARGYCVVDSILAKDGAPEARYSAAR